MPAKQPKAKSTSTRKAKPAAPSSRSGAAARVNRSASATRKAAVPRETAAAPAKLASKAAAPKTASAKKTAKTAKEAAPVVRRSSAELHFTETTILRGEAVEPGKALPSGATHEIAGHDDCGQPILKRKRFSIY
jgi:hypothetical protein